MNQRALFISHGAPDELLHDSPARRAWADLGLAGPVPRAILAVSAHFEHSPGVSVGAAERPVSLHDFFGFDPRLREFAYRPPGEPELARQVAELLREAGLETVLDHRRGLDHGTWMPLSEALPEARVPIVPVSVNPQGDARWHLELGRALAPLADEDVLLLGTGALTHDLRGMDRHDRDAPPACWAREFAERLRQAIEGDDLETLLAWESLPNARVNHPTPEHLMPLFVAVGYGGLDAVTIRHQGYALGTIAMDIYGFGAVPRRAGNGTTTEIASAV